MCRSVFKTDASEGSLYNREGPVKVLMPPCTLPRKLDIWKSRFCRAQAMRGDVWGLLEAQRLCQIE